MTCSHCEVASVQLHMHMQSTAASVHGIGVIAILGTNNMLHQLEQPCASCAAANLACLQPHSRPYYTNNERCHKRAHPLLLTALDNNDLPQHSTTAHDQILWAAAAHTARWRVHATPHVQDRSATLPPTYSCTSQTTVARANAAVVVCCATGPGATLRNALCSAHALADVPSITALQTMHRLHRSAPHGRVAEVRTAARSAHNRTRASAHSAGGRPARLPNWRWRSAKAQPSPCRLQPRVPAWTDACGQAPAAIEAAAGKGSDRKHRATSCRAFAAHQQSAVSGRRRTDSGRAPTHHATTACAGMARTHTPGLQRQQHTRLAALDQSNTEQLTNAATQSVRRRNNHRSINQKTSWTHLSG